MARHGDHTGLIVFQIRFDFELNSAFFSCSRIGKATSAGALGTSALDNKTGFVAMEGQAVVKAAAYQIQKNYAVLGAPDWSLVNSSILIVPLVVSTWTTGFGICFVLR